MINPTTSESLLRQFQAAIKSIKSPQPFPVAIAMRPSFYQRVVGHPEVKLKQGAALIPGLAGIPCYVWPSLPEGCRAYRTIEALEEDRALFGGVDD